MSLLHPANIGLIVIAAIGYSAATIGMKMGSVAITGATCLVAISVIALGFAAAIYCEVSVMRNVHLGAVYIAIIGVETLLVLLYACYIGETPSLRQFGGAGLVLTGLIVVAE